jgi:hypothetical protein
MTVDEALKQLIDVLDDHFNPDVVNDHLRLDEPDVIFSRDEISGCEVCLPKLKQIYLDGRVMTQAEQAIEWQEKDDEKRVYADAPNNLLAYWDEKDGEIWWLFTDGSVLAYDESSMSAWTETLEDWLSTVNEGIAAGNGRLYAANEKAKGLTKA